MWKADSQRILFALATAIPVACVATLFVWSASDASFPWASWLIQAILGLKDTKPLVPSPIEINVTRAPLQWDYLGSRVAAMLALYGVGFTCTAALAIQCARRATMKRVLTCILILASWSAFVGTRRLVDQWRTVRQVTAILPQFEVAADQLTTHWPDEPGEIPGVFKYYAGSERRPDVLIVRNGEKYPSHETFGLLIHRGVNGIIRFDLAGAPESCLEYHPNGTEPAAHVSRFGRPSPPVASAYQVNERWFLVRYGTAAW